MLGFRVHMCDFRPVIPLQKALAKKKTKCAAIRGQDAAPKRVTPHAVAPVAKSGSLQHGVQIGDWGDRLSGEGAPKELLLQLAKQNEMECNYRTRV